MNKGPRDTICDQGCAMSSISSALAGHGYRIPSYDNKISHSNINPGTLNKWIRANHGYLCIGGDCNNLNLTLITQLDPHSIQYRGEQPKPSEYQLATSISNPNRIHIAHVRDNSHFVLMTGIYLPDTHSFSVMDPFFNVTVYSYDEISDIIRYDMTKQS